MKWIRHALPVSCCALLAGCAGSFGSSGVYRGRMTQEPQSIIRVANTHERKEAFTFNPFKFNKVTEIVAVSDLGPTPPGMKSAHATSAMVPPGNYLVMVLCTYNYNPLIQRGFNVTVRTEPGHDYTVECLGRPSGGSVNVADWPQQNTG
ncbi:MULTISPECIES: hypothetical protein [Dyella]|uniref:Lipoprotein n=2 Tax=Dyella TaxID=231454 RepID=A0A4R0YX91_9GAMM|nr:MULTISPECIES: hypothetical protein [Dyella]TBR40544.1 hypothetical protein EYV96_10445 [Dyella terrae]TCI11874.1 hypothetical protein EZM97_00425 [Dyella soli]